MNDLTLHIETRLDGFSRIFSLEMLNIKRSVKYKAKSLNFHCYSVHFGTNKLEMFSTLNIELPYYLSFVFYYKMVEIRFISLETIRYVLRFLWTILNFRKMWPKRCHRSIIRSIFVGFEWSGIYKWDTGYQTQTS